MYIYNNQYAGQQKLTQHYKSTILLKKRNVPSYVTWKQESDILERERNYFLLITGLPLIKLMHFTDWL